MARLKVVPTGIQATEKYLNVSICLETGGADQFAVVKIPLLWLLSDHITDALDREVRRALIQQWSEVDLADPLF